MALFRRVVWGMFLLVGLLLFAGCDSLVSQTPTATLRGAIVPTRIPTETPTATQTSSRTPTPTVTPVIPTPTPTLTSTRTPTQITTSTLVALAASPSAEPLLTATPRRLMPTQAATLELVMTSGAMTATEQKPMPMTPSRPANVIEITGENEFIYSGTLDRRNFDFWFTFEAEANQIIGIEMKAKSGDLDPFLRLLNSAGDILIENDDDPEGSNRDAYIRDFVLPEDGQYTIIATRFQRGQGSTTGDFTLIVAQSAVLPDVTMMPTATEGVPLLASGDILEGTLDDDTPLFEYVFEVDSAAIIEIELTALSGNLDAYLLILDANGEILIENDDDPQGSGRDAYIREFQLPTAGQYTIVATRFRQAQGSTSGAFRLRFAILNE